MEKKRILSKDKTKPQLNNNAMLGGVSFIEGKWANFAELGLRHHTKFNPFMEWCTKKKYKPQPGPKKDSLPLWKVMWFYEYICETKIKNSLAVGMTEERSASAPPPDVESLIKLQMGRQEGEKRRESCRWMRGCDCGIRNLVSVER